MRTYSSDNVYIGPSYTVPSLLHAEVFWDSHIPCISSSRYRCTFNIPVAYTQDLFQGRCITVFLQLDAGHDTAPALKM